MTDAGVAGPGLRDFSGTLLLVGAGKMGGAMLEGWLALGLDPARVTVLEPQPAEELAALAARGLRLNPARPAPEAPTVIVVAVKPQTAPEVAPILTRMAGPSTLVVSIMAGRTLQFLEHALPGKAIVRAMPNTPAAIGRGITVAVANAGVSADQRALSHGLLAATGAVEWIDDEGLLDAVTAVSGSGPAYVFLLAESLARAGVAAGLPEGTRGAAGAGDGRRIGRASAPLRTRPGAVAAERDVPRGHDGGRARRADGGRRPLPVAGTSGCSRGPPRP